MPKIEIELISPGIEALLKSQEVGDYIQRVANEAARDCGNEYETDRKMMSTRVISSVFTTDKKALQDNLDNNTLLKVVGNK